jgi:uncharacterized protein (DUF1697 family)
MAAAQHRFVALLRAINVGGHGIVKMADLRAQFESLGLTEVATYIQSGNVLFNSKDADARRIAERLEKKLGSSLGYRGLVFVLSPEELRQAAQKNPFDPERLDAEQRCHLMFLSGEPDGAHRKALMAVQGEEYRFAIREKVLYYAYSRTFEGGRRTINFEKILGVAGTARSWTVVKKLIELLT